MDEVKKIQLTVFDTQRLEDITDSVDHFEMKETLIHAYAWLVIKDERIGLCRKREPPINDVYSIQMTDIEGNKTHRMMEVADEIQDQIPIHLDHVMRQIKHWQETVEN
jgi:hypothetical protein